MNQNLFDEKLELYISKIKTSNNTHNKVLNYKRATTRLAELKTEYQKLCGILKEKDHHSENSDRDSKKNHEKVDLDKIMVELNDINAELTKGGHNMQELVDHYIQYKLLLNELDIEAEEIKNEIFKVEKNKKNKITIHKLELDDII